MNWEAIGAVGEILGAAAVVITLAYLVVQLRLNTTAMKAHLFRSQSGGRCEMSRKESQDRDLLGDCIVIDALLSAIIYFDENSEDGLRACHQQTLAIIAREKFSELRDGIDEAESDRWQRPTLIEGGAS